jgi:hypothetical protein
MRYDNWNLKKQSERSTGTVRIKFCRSAAVYAVYRYDLLSSILGTWDFLEGVF